MALPRHIGKREKSGRDSDKVLGICAHFAFILLKYARISGDEDSLNAGLKGAKGHGPVQNPARRATARMSAETPTLLAVAYAVGAYVEATR